MKNSQEINRQRLKDIAADTDFSAYAEHYRTKLQKQVMHEATGEIRRAELLAEYWAVGKFINSMKSAVIAKQE